MREIWIRTKINTGVLKKWRNVSMQLETPVGIGKKEEWEGQRM